MKTIIIALVFGMSLSSFAQSSTPQPGSSNMEKMTPQQRQQKHLAKLTKDLNLNDSQQAAVGKILADKSSAMQDLKSQKDARKSSGEKMTPAEKEALKTKMMAEKTDTDTQMKSILSADQYTKWQSMREDKKDKMMEKKKSKM